MAENTKTEPKNKVSHWSNIKTEFRKVIWPTKERAAKQTVAVVAVSVVMGLLIALIDTVIRYGLGLIL